MPKHVHILHPKRIPTPDTIQCSLSDDFFRGIEALISESSWANNAIGAGQLLNVITELASARVKTRELGNDEVSLSPDDSVHDDYFFIRRSGGPASEVFVQTILNAHLLLLEDAWENPFSISAEKLGVLDSAMGSLLCWSMGIEPPRAMPRVSSWIAQEGRPQSMRRWVRGHQIFAALTQGLICALVELRTALRKEEYSRATQAGNLVVLLLNGSAVSFEFTGDFPPRDYIDIIRPSMTPPAVPDTFSGLLSVDHRCLVQLLREMRPSLEALAESDADQHKRIASALATVYDSHRFVCSRLVGKCPSLMMAAGSKKSGAEQIEKFKHLRMKVFEPKEEAETADVVSQPR